MIGDVSVRGGATSSRILYGPESHKLHLEFDLSPDPSADLIHRGQPVTLKKVNYSGTDYDVIAPAAFDADESEIIGISTHEQDSAYKGAIVVAVRGYAVVLCKLAVAVDAGAKLAVGNGEALVGDQEVYDATDGYCLVQEIEATGEGTLQYGWALETGTADDIIQVLIKN